MGRKNEGGYRLGAQGWNHFLPVHRLQSGTGVCGLQHGDVGGIRHPDSEQLLPCYAVAERNPLQGCGERLPRRDNVRGGGIRRWHRQNLRSPTIRGTPGSFQSRGTQKWSTQTRYLVPPILRELQQ